MYAAERIRHVEDARLLAKRRLPPFLYRGYESGTAQCVTVRRNQKAFTDRWFTPRAGVHYPDRSLATTLLGQEIAMPILLSPVGALRTGAPGQGELAVARAAGEAGVIQVVSSFTGYPIEEVMAAASGPVFFQLYMLGGRSGVERMVARARDAGCSALVVTADMAAHGIEPERTYRERRSAATAPTLTDAMRIAPQLIGHLPWLCDFILDGKPAMAPMQLDEYSRPVSLAHGAAHQLDHVFVWEDLAWISKVWDAPLIVKGIMRVDDAIRARDLGAQAIIVSNHGGNHLDGSAATLDVLPEIVKAVGEDVAIVLDGGVRRGADVVKALALGADCVGIGRAYVYGLLAAGEAGVRRILEMFALEIANILDGLGCPSIDAVDSSYLTPTPTPTQILLS